MPHIVQAAKKGNLFSCRECAGARPIVGNAPERQRTTMNPPAWDAARVGEPVWVRVRRKGVVVEALIASGVSVVAVSAARDRRGAGKVCVKPCGAMSSARWSWASFDPLRPCAGRITNIDRAPTATSQPVTACRRETSQNA